ncbi:hypothetical protein E2986_13660 [Frieseomelitta varia]|uniref:Uncharacterized protein n=1 Tax=Frieseomelitta varia TaxID=561572 RepID=A0A833RYD2_9HYME|nr:hypothetical protein E2986_13660 [Frieseomelitta varia]
MTKRKKKKFAKVNALRQEMISGLDIFVCTLWPIKIQNTKRRQTRKSNEIEHKEYNQHVVQRHRISLRAIEHSLESKIK